MRQRGDDTQNYSIAHLKWQHGVNCDDDEEEEGHLKRKKERVRDERKNVTFI